MRAAELMDTDVTRFILDRIIPDAERIVAQREGTKIVLTAEHWMEFCKHLDEAPKDLPGMRRLLSRPSRFVDADER